MAIEQTPVGLRVRISLPDTEAVAKELRAKLERVLQLVAG